MSDQLRIAVIGAGRMGSDHIRRIRDRIQGARITAIVDIDESRARQAVDGIDGARVYTDFIQALDSGEVDAVLISTPGFLHEQVLLPAITRGLPVLCEKPLTPDSESAWRVVQAEVQAGRRLVQVGFMRRFDAGYRKIEQAVRTGEHGQLLALDCEHINPEVPEGYTGRNLIDDTVVHEFDVVRFLAGQEVAAIQVRTGRTSGQVRTAGLVDPAQVLMDTVDGIRVTVNTHVTAGYGYAVTTRATFETAHVEAGVGEVTPGFEERFEKAYDVEVQEWVDAAREGKVAGPDAWDGYAAAVCCEAGLAAVEAPGSTAAVRLNAKPDLYSETGSE